MRFIHLLLLCSVLSGCLSKPAPWNPDWGTAEDEIFEDRRSGEGTPGEVGLPGDLGGELPADVTGEELPLDLLADLAPDTPPDLTSDTPPDLVDLELTADIVDVPDIAEVADIDDDHVDLVSPDLEDVESELPVDLVEEIEPDVCEPDCEDLECGSDGCGGTCGECVEGDFCIAGECHPDYCLEGLEEFGCCLDGVAVWCGEDGLDWADCEDAGCGWEEGQYSCGSVGEDPLGEFPLACCLSDCEGKACGPDGCWGDCGECEDDGNDCTDTSCDSGTCVHQNNDDNECDDEDPDTVTVCLEGDCVCVPQCEGKDCGPDTCGGTCGQCGDFEECQAGQCICLPDCEGKECGDDGCGDSCGSCDPFGGYACISGGCACAQAPVIGKAVFNKEKSNGDYQFCYGAAKSANGGYLLVGRAYESTLDDEIAIWRHQPDGSHTYGESGTGPWDEGRAVVPSGAGTYMLGGSSSKPGGPTKRDCRLAKLHESNHTLAWDKHFGGSLMEECYDLETLPNGNGFVMVGYSESFTNGGKDLWLVHADTGGVQSGAYHYGSTADDGGRGVVVADDGYAIAGWTKGSGSSEAWLVKMTPFGAVSWEVILGPGAAYDLVQTEDGGYLVVGEGTGEGADGKDAWAWRTDSDGEPLWDTLLLGGAGENSLYAVTAHPDGGYVAAGKMSTGAAGSSDGLLVRFSDTGVKHWASAYGASKMDELNTIWIEDPGHIVFAGTREGDNYQQENMWLVKLGLECGN